jgi:hypothetical protein
MTTPVTTPAAARSWWTRPAVVLPLIGAIVVFVAIRTPEPQSGRLGDARLSTHLAGSLGARLLHDMAGRLGWRVVARDSSPVPTRAPGETIHAVLAPPLRPTAAQAHRYMDAVRNGDALLLALDGRNPLSDSLGVRHTPTGGVLDTPTEDKSDEDCTTRDRTPTLWPDGQAHLYGVRFIRANPAPPPRVVFATVHAPEGERQEDAALGFQLGRGRVVVVSDPDLLRNDVLRRCQWGADVIAVRMLEWLRDGGPVPRTRLEFDEYHQGYGPRHSATATVGGFLARHPVGRAILVLVLGALVLLLAVSPRALLPTQRLVVERRDPLEQVDALAHAYEQVRATRTAVARLLHGVRSRIERGGVLARARTDDTFLDDVVAMDAARAADVALVRRALREPAAAGDLPTIGAALRRIEHSFTTRRA